MCGIFGGLGKSQAINFSNAAIMQRMIGHRGPDGAGVHQAEEHFFGNVRLAIVDRALGHQPIYTEDKRYCIVYNGEVYNHNELRDELKAKGHRFETHSDTEVLLKAFAQWGVESFSRFNGMFSFCIWDNLTKEAYVVRDPIGIKPLYIYEDDQRIYFASELKAILALGDVDASMDPRGVQDYLFFRYVCAPYTLFSKIRKLHPGTYFHFKNGKGARWNYSKMLEPCQHLEIPEPEAREQLTQLLSKATQSQLMGEVPVGVLLSGGVDSSAIAYFVHEAGANLKTFNIGFPEVNEFAYSRAVAKKINLEHIEIETSVDELVELYPQVSWALDEPIADPACLPLYRLCAELKKHVVVVLSGEGGDELFGGYNQYKSLLQKGFRGDQSYSDFVRDSWYFTTEYKEFMKQKDISSSVLRFRKYFQGQDLLSGALDFDMNTWMPDNLMMKADKILMSHSLEGRFPFLDHDLYRFSKSLPTELKIDSNFMTKKILKNAIEPVMPSEIVGRAKMGFTVPTDLILKKMKPIVLETFRAFKTSEWAEIVDSHRIEQTCTRFYDKGDNSQTLLLWTLFSLAFWTTNTLRKYRHSLT